MYITKIGLINIFKYIFKTIVHALKILWVKTKLQKKGKDSWVRGQQVIAKSIQLAAEAAICSFHWNRFWI